MSKPFASHGDVQDKRITFTRITDRAYAYEAESDPTSGVVIGDDAVMVIDTRATPDLAQDVIAKVRAVTDKPIKYVVLSHYHAVRVMGAAAFPGAQIICSEATLELIRERGAADFKSEVERFPRLFKNVEAVPGLTYPTITFSERMSLFLGSLQVDLIHLGRGHTQGDTIVRLPSEGTIFSGDLVENGAAVYAGDAHIADWLVTLGKLRALKPTALVPGRGPALLDAAKAEAAIGSTEGFLQSLLESVKGAVAQGGSLKDSYAAARRAMDAKYGAWPIYEHCMPFDVSRCFDEVSGQDRPKIWTAERDREMWDALQAAPAH